MIYKINVKEGNVSSDTAVIRLSNSILTEKRKGTKIIKIIHGYGSTGVGGAIRIAVRDFLRKNSKMYGIKHVIFGENFNTSSASTVPIVKQYPQLRTDEDFNKENDGITIIVLN